MVSFGNLLDIYIYVIYSYAKNMYTGSFPRSCLNFLILSRTKSSLSRFHVTNYTQTKNLFVSGNTFAETAYSDTTAQLIINCPKEIG